MKIFFTQHFKKRFNKLPSKIQRQFEKRLTIFIKNPIHPLLKTHPLKGNLAGFRAFSVTGDYRIIYRILERDAVKLIDIGSHSWVYR